MPLLQETPVSPDRVSDAPGAALPAGLQPVLPCGVCGGRTGAVPAIYGIVSVGCSRVFLDPKVTTRLVFSSIGFV